MTVKPDSRKLTPEAQLRAYIDKLDPKNQKLFRSVRAAVRKRFPTANELAYDYNRFFVIGYSPTDRGIDAIVAIRASATGVSLYFSQGPQLPDPRRLLRGSGKQVRFIQVEAASQLAHPDVEALIAATIDQARIPLPTEGKGSLIIKSDGEKKPPRRKPSK
jgi:single-stranded DNA-specific DHH superfamily exonuclease